MTAKKQTHAEIYAAAAAAVEQAQALAAEARAVVEQEAAERTERARAARLVLARRTFDSRDAVLTAVREAGKAHAAKRDAALRSLDSLDVVVAAEVAYLASRGARSLWLARVSASARLLGEDAHEIETDRREIKTVFGVDLPIAVAIRNRGQALAEDVLDDVLVALDLADLVNGEE